jgi:enhancing lycopene biosynthesis protein 2
MKIGVLLSGAGVYDGAEIQEAVLAMLAIQEAGCEYVCISIDKSQYHVINHLDGSEMNETRNMLVEAARIARGSILKIEAAHPADLDGLVIPCGFGSSKNFTNWAFEGPAGTILPEVKLLIINFLNVGKPIAALCVSPVVVAKALENSGIDSELTLGSTQEKSPNSIADFHAGIEKTGVKSIEKTVEEIHIDVKNKIITAPCYMMDASLVEIRKNIQAAIHALIALT